MLKKNYPDLFPTIEKIELISGININSRNYKVGDYYLKTLDDNQYTQRVPCFPKIIECLKKKGLPTPEIIPNKFNELISSPNIKGQNRLFFFVQPFIEGNFFTGSVPEFKNALILLKNIEDAFESLNPTSAHLNPYKDWNPSIDLEVIKRILKKKEEKNQLDSFDKRLLPYFKEFKRISNFYIKNKNQLSLENLHHYDLHPHNVLFNGENLVAVLDLDNIGAIDKRIATAFNLYKLGRKSISKGQLDIKEFQRMADDFFDLSYLISFAKIELLQRITKLFRYHYLKDLNTWDQDLEKYICGLEEIDLMFDGKI